MQKPIYADAVTETAIKSLTDVLKDAVDILEIEGWSKMKAPDKRANFLEALTQSEELRKKFVFDYGQRTGTPTVFSEWEAGDEPTVEDAAPPVEDTLATPPAPDEVPEAELILATDPDLDPTPSQTPALVTEHAMGTFVEGGFEAMKADAAGLDAVMSDSALKSAEENLEFEHIRLGVLLSHISNSQHYLTLGYENMREYLSVVSGLDYRKAMQLIRNATIISELNIPATNLKGVTWAALRHVLPVLTQDNYAIWLDAASNMKHMALIEAVKDERVKQAGLIPASNTATAVPIKPETKPKTFNLLPDQLQSVNNAIEKAKVEGNVATTGAALDVMAASYSGKPVTQSTLNSGVTDTSDAALMDVLTKLRADEGIDGLIRVLNFIGTVWPEPDISVDLKAPTAQAAE